MPIYEEAWHQMAESSSSPQDGVTKSPQIKLHKASSCIRCFERKVKCNKEVPCDNCIKSNAECIPRIPPAPRRRKKRTQEDILKAKLDQYEHLLRMKGIDVQPPGPSTEDTPETVEPVSRGNLIFGSTLPKYDQPEEVSRPNTQKPCLKKSQSGRLINTQNRSWFVDNNLWTTISEEFRKSDDAIPESSDEDEAEADLADEGTDYVLGLTPMSQTGLRNLHPFPEQISTLWHVFLDNVNPLSKIIHVPSLQPAILDAGNRLDNLPKNFEALIFSIYSIAVLSLTPQDCLTMLSEPKALLLSRYRKGTKRALARAHFLGTSDIMVLQAYILHLLCMRDTYDHRTLWTLTGVANRIAEGMGVHKDGTTLGLPPFETEMRRRLWWQLTFLDFRTAEMVGTGSSASVRTWSCKLPSNIDDTDIYPGMKEPPVNRPGVTEMIFCLNRYEIGNFWKEKLVEAGPHAELWNITNGHVEAKDAIVDELDRLLRQKYVQHCDPSQAPALMACLVTTAAISGMRLMVHHPKRYDNEEDVPESERQLLWNVAMKLIETDNLMYGTILSKRFTWHTEHYFQWQSLIYILNEMKKAPLADKTDRAWCQVHTIFDNHPRFYTDFKKPIHVAIGNLLLKAWSAREDTWSQRPYVFPLQVPDYINTVRKQREEAEAKAKRAEKERQMLSDASNGISNFSLNQYQDHSSIGMPMNTHAAMPAARIKPVFPVFPTMPNIESGPINFEMSRQISPNQTQIAEFPMATSSAPMPVDNSAVYNNISNPISAVAQAFKQQQPNYYWWDYSNMGNGTEDIDFNSVPIMPANSNDMLQHQDSMDWNQWDFLLKEVRPSG